MMTIKDTAANIGDTIKIYYKFNEGEKTKEQIFQGILIRIKGEKSNKMFTVRRVSKEKIGIERIFPLVSPFIDKIVVVKKGVVRRSKLYFIRGLSDTHLRERLS